MTRMRVKSIIRRQDYYRPMLAALQANGIEDFEIDPPNGLGHPILRFTANGGEHRIPLPGTPSGGSEARHYIPNEIRRRVQDRRK